MYNICPCYFQCENKTELGYCKTSVCINQKIMVKLYHPIIVYQSNPTNYNKK